MLLKILEYIVIYAITSYLVYLPLVLTLIKYSDNYYASIPENTSNLVIQVIASPIFLLPLLMEVIIQSFCNCMEKISNKINPLYEKYLKDNGYRILY